MDILDNSHVLQIGTVSMSQATKPTGSHTTSLNNNMSDAAAEELS